MPSLPGTATRRIGFSWITSSLSNELFADLVAALNSAESQ